MTGVERSASASKMCLACNREFQGELSRCPQDGTALISLKQEDEWIGKVLADRYEVTKLLGKGGMGVVYLAKQRMIDRLVAVKMLQAELTQDEMSVKRFQQEAKAASCLSHPHLVTLHDYGITNTGQPFLVMEYLEGKSLLEVVKLNGPLSAPRAVKIFSEVAEGLFHAHNQGILHRDLKPSNILLLNQEGDPDFVKIVDFGLAKLMPWSGKESQHLTKTGEVFGSPIYMSPEQCMGRELRPPSDIYSLGITLFECLTGKPPFRGSNSIQTASKHMSDPPPRFIDVRPDLQLPEGLEKVVMKMLEKEPADRFQTMAEVKDSLQSSLHRVDPTLVTSSRVSAVDSTTALPSLKNEQDKLRSKSALRDKQSEQRGLNPAIIAAAAVLLLAVGGGSYFAITHAPKPTPDPVNGYLFFFDPAGKKAEISIGAGSVKFYDLSSEASQQLKTYSHHDNPLAHPVKASVVKTSIDSIEVNDGNDQAVGAVKLVGDFMEEALTEPENAQKLFQFKPKKDWHRSFDEKGLRTSGFSSGKTGFIEERPLSALRIYRLNGDTQSILADKKAYLQEVPEHAPYWLVVVRKNKIIEFRDALPKEWEVTSR